MFKMLAPILRQNRASPLLIFHWPIVRPRMDFKFPGAFCATVPENLMRPPTFEIAATPNSDAANIWKFQCAVHPSAAGPFGRSYIPIGMVIKRDENHGLGNKTQPKSG